MCAAGQANEVKGPNVCPPIGIGVYPQALAGLPKIWTLSMGYFSNPNISDILNPPNGCFYLALKIKYHLPLI